MCWVLTIKTITNGMNTAQHGNSASIDGFSRLIEFAVHDVDDDDDDHANYLITHRAVSLMRSSMIRLDSIRLRISHDMNDGEASVHRQRARRNNSTDLRLFWYRMCMVEASNIWVHRCFITCIYVHVRTNRQYTHSMTWANDKRKQNITRTV